MVANMIEFDARFPEDLFPPVNIAKYNQKIRDGQTIAKKCNVQIIGLAYQCEGIIERNIQRCVELGKHFKDYSILILENGSKDKTGQKIVEFKDKNKRVRYIIESKTKPAFGPLDPVRFMYLAELRNTLLDGVSSGSFDSDFLIVYDFDIKGGFSYDGIMSSLSEEKEACFSNGIVYVNNVRQYYDYITLRQDSPSEDWRREYAKLSFKRGTHLLKYNSGFGGLGVYRTKKALNSEYNHKYGCEHVAFSQGMDTYLNPDQIVLYDESNYLK
jgi:hypothetical protein